jgi:hypothetical protein
MFKKKKKANKMEKLGTVELERPAVLEHEDSEPQSKPEPHPVLGE